MEKIFSAYLVIGGVPIKEENYDLFVKEVDENEYQELITGEIFRNYICGDMDLSVCLCYSLDSTLQYDQIHIYLKYEADRVRRIINSCKPKINLKAKKPEE